MAGASWGIRVVDSGHDIAGPLAAMLAPGGDRPAAFDRIHALFPVLAERGTQLAGNLSGGQQQMLAIARALLGRPQPTWEAVMSPAGETA